MTAIARTLVGEPDALAKTTLTLFDLTASPAELAGHYACLDSLERERARRFPKDRDRERFAARRGHLRSVLAHWVGERPSDLRIDVDCNGKPFLSDYSDVHFSMSHSRGLALCAVGHGVAVGCDLEWRDPRLACPYIAKRFFAPAEQAALAELAQEEWIEGFFNCWTRKEAYVKALGLGLSYPLQSFTVSLAPGTPARLVDAPSSWSLSSFEPAPGYQAALVTGRPD